jgi:hypothetical protein
MDQLGSKQGYGVNVVFYSQGPISRSRSMRTKTRRRRRWLTRIERKKASERAEGAGHAQAQAQAQTANQAEGLGGQTGEKVVRVPVLGCGAARRSFPFCRIGCCVGNFNAARSWVVVIPRTHHGCAGVPASTLGIKYPWMDGWMDGWMEVCYQRRWLRLACVYEFRRPERVCCTRACVSSPPACISLLPTGASRRPI